MASASDVVHFDDLLYRDNRPKNNVIDQSELRVLIKVKSKIKVDLRNLPDFAGLLMLFASWNDWRISVSLTITGSFYV